MHLDLETDDVGAEVKRLDALGASRWDYQKERGFDFGSCAIRGPTNSAYSSQGSQNSLRRGDRGLSYVWPEARRPANGTSRCAVDATCSDQVQPA
jgi:hypothetical protein